MDNIYCLFDILFKFDNVVFIYKEDEIGNLSIECNIVKKYK